MFIKSIEIFGYRGFGRPARIAFAIPDGRAGSGLTTIVGANNVGKSSVIEVLAALGTPSRKSFSQGKRNPKAGDRVTIKVEDVDGQSHELSTAGGGSETEWKPPGNHPRPHVLPSRRYFDPYFSKNVWGRDQFTQHMAQHHSRGRPVEAFSYRMFTALENRDRFDAVLRRIISPLPDWTIDQTDTGQYFLKFLTSGGYHSSEGLGEGLVSLFFIVDALYDSSVGDIIVIDEPELSLHPALQRRLMALLLEYAGERQIICATHSPYFVDLTAVASSAEICRMFLNDGDSQAAALSRKTGEQIQKLLSDLNNPHTFGLNAREVFFLEDNVILLEGQEDVVFYDRVTAAAGIELEGSYFGWGVGGADKMRLVAQMLSDLEYKKVVGLLDGNRKDVLASLKSEFPDYHFDAIPADDVRTKSARPARPKVVGLLDGTGVLRPEFLEPLRSVLKRVQSYLADRHGV